MTPTNYLDRARKLANLPSDRALADRLGMSASWVTWVRTRRTLPSDETMLRLAELAAVPPEEALLDLNEWRSETSSRARAVYASIKQKLAVAGILAALVIVPTSSVFAGTIAEQTALKRGILYIITNETRRLIVRFLTLLLRQRRDHRWAAGTTKQWNQHLAAPGSTGERAGTCPKSYFAFSPIWTLRIPALSSSASRRGFSARRARSAARSISSRRRNAMRPSGRPGWRPGAAPSDLLSMNGIVRLCASHASAMATTRSAALRRSISQGAR